ncbi:hypothetical protein BJP25_07065 [Actinokineospora bangkokensis]|uniref:Uncharacterized protein n=1 Tax=Actinokineospora bangkokensis TaxID=1193682 RepID=A0A1Q9LTB5_9PSEU|nr:hypothetical protein BJP25_07065 [Actinokineospora bangkokensis]
MLFKYSTDERGGQDPDPRPRVKDLQRTAAVQPWLGRDDLSNSARSEELSQLALHVGVERAAGLLTTRFYFGQQRGDRI